MKPRRAFLICVLAVGAFLSLTVSARRLAHREAALESGRDHLSRTVEDARRIVALRTREERIALQERPKEDVIALVNAALAEAGLPARHFSDLRNESDSALPQTGNDANFAYRKQSLSLTLREMRPVDLGGFLAAWEQTQSAWIVTRITLTHPNRSRRDDDLFDIILVVTALYVESS